MISLGQVLRESTIKIITTRSRSTISDVARELLELDLELGLRLDLVLKLETTLALELDPEPGLPELGMCFDSSPALYRYMLVHLASLQELINRRQHRIRS